MRALILGGAGDGRVVEAEGIALRVPVRRPLSTWSERGPAPMQYHLYRREMLVADDREWHFFVLEGESTADAMDRLWKGYKP